MNILLYNSSNNTSTAVNYDEDLNCRLIKTESKSTLENYKLKPIEKIQKQMTYDKYTVNNFEKFFMLKIKCKCIHILNRLISLVGFLFCFQYLMSY